MTYKKRSCAQTLTSPSPVPAKVQKVTSKRKKDVVVADEGGHQEGVTESSEIEGVTASNETGETVEAGEADGSGDGSEDVIGGVTAAGMTPEPAETGEPKAVENSSQVMIQAKDDEEASAPSNIESDDGSHRPATKSPEVIFKEVVGPNPYYTGQLASVPILKGILAVTLDRYRFRNRWADVSMFDVLKTHRPQVAKRILQISNHQDVVQFKTPPGGLVNVSVADPTKLKTLKGVVVSTEHNSFVVGTITGVTTLFANNDDDIREICVKPFFHSWPRFTAVLGQAFQADAIFFRTWQDGVVFGTGIFESRGMVFGSEVGDANCPPIHGPNLLKNEKIPVYDGRSKFSLAKYWEKEYTDDVAPGSTVFVLFSVRKGKPHPNADYVKAKNMAVVYLNVLGIVVIADPSDAFCLDQTPDPKEVHGVDVLPRLKDYVEAEAGGEEDKKEPEVF